MLAPLDMDQDELLERRFVLKAAKHGLPSKRTWLFREIAPEMQSLVNDKIGDRFRGRPVLIFVDSPSRWTLLTTQCVFSWYQERLHEASVDDLSEVGANSAPPQDGTTEEIHNWKVSWEYLRLVNNAGVTVVWVPCGGEAFALWNMLLPLTRHR
jgi:hypothetical protein